ncbi:MAG: nicotinate-nucleotide--dimethylbenzimidazole phosphoribosyltransferase [Candidatus Latescibacteria bacterium]|nr:nicotinate-nucleotide--dimethylbenzimidazole phosphoribosyltransferase [Candidatus Latescibacterota bacterium]
MKGRNTVGLLETTTAQIVPQDASWRTTARGRLEQLTMPYWALGRLMDLAEDLAGITRSMQPPVTRRVIVTMASDHGVAAEGVSQYPQEVTAQMVHNFAQGGAGINALAQVGRARLVVVDMGVLGDLSPLVRAGKILSRRMGPGTRNIAHGPAMEREEAVRCLEAGIMIAQELGPSVDLFGTGDMGIGNTTPSSAIAAVFSGRPAIEVTGRGTGIDEARLGWKSSIVQQALDLNRPDPADGLDVLAKVGGFEIGGIAGLILGAAAQRKPVIVDGFISTAGALIAHALAPGAADYMIAAHRSAERGHRLMLDYLGKHPLLDLDLRLGEGTGAALAMPLIEAAARLLSEVSTFAEAAVSEAAP